VRVLIVDPSSRGGIPLYTALIAKALQRSGIEGVVLGSRGLEEVADGVPTLRRLPVEDWGKPAAAGPGFYARRALTWLRSAAIVLAAVRRVDPDVVHFQMPINRRFDVHLLRWLGRRRQVVWTAHNVLPFESTEADSRRFAAIYRAVDGVIVHTRPAAEQLQAIAGVKAVVIEHPVPEGIARVPAAEARGHLGLPATGRLLCALGFIRAYKGYELLADVWERLGRDAPKLLVMGELLAHDEQHVLDRLARCDQVELRLGYASERDLQLAACAADALLLPYTVASDSGLVHLARATGVPVIASDAPQLAASVSATRSGTVLPREVEAWASAVTGELPQPPAPPPPLEAVGAAHAEVYGQLGAARSRRRPLRIVLYTDATERGGAEGVLAMLIAGLDPQLEVILMGVDETIVEWLARGRAAIRTCVVPPVRDKRDLRPLIAHWRALRSLRPDIFQANLRNPWSCQYGILAALLTPRTKVVALEHLPTQPTAQLQRRLKRMTSRRLDAHVAVGNQSARELERLIGLREGAVRTIHNGVRAEASESPQALARLTAAGHGRRIVAGLGRLTPQKGFDILFAALVQLPHLEALIVGEGPERQRLERLRDELGLGERVRLPGATDDPAALLQEIDALVLPSRSEALPLVVLEAMHAGLPVVASDVGSVAEAVLDGVTGLLVPAEDPAALAVAISHVLDPEVGARMGAEGRMLAAARFTCERMVRDYELLYDELCG
jgi:glycosyltransferase involved in cell wall biosynthesis